MMKDDESSLVASINFKSVQIISIQEYFEHKIHTIPSSLHSDLALRIEYLLEELNPDSSDSV